MTLVADRSAERALLRADVSLAAKVLAPNWPLGTFIAVNPLGGLEDKPFGDAIETAAGALGARGTLDLTTYREAHAAGRITSADLLGVLARRHPQALSAPAVGLAGRSVPARELLLADLLEGPVSGPPARGVRTLSEQVDPQIADVIDAQTTKWCAAFLDAGQAGWSMPMRDRGFYAAWRALAPQDRTVPATVRGTLRTLPSRADDAVLEALSVLEVADEHRAEYLRAHLTRLPGWSSHVRWHADQGEDITLVDLLALRLSYERALLDTPVAATADPQPLADRHPTTQARARAAIATFDTAQPKDAEVHAVAQVLDLLPARDRELMWQEAYEGHYRDRLLGALTRPLPERSEARPAAQLVCCIDARSEGLRRQLERLGDYDTLGFAGFFAVAIRYHDLAGGRPSALCPVLLSPRNEVHEVPAPGDEARADRQLAGQRALSGVEDGFHAAKDDLISPFALAEAAGWASGPLAAAKTMAAGPYGALRDRLHRRAAPPAPTVVVPQESFGAQERALVAEATLTMMGLTKDFGRVVVLCGHGSTTENNPYESALACGACGGNAGGPNARTAAAILNGDDVREHLAAKGIAIPQDTWFVAAEHDTASDRVTLLDRHLVPESHHDDVAHLEADLREAGRRLSAERSQTLPGAPSGATPGRAARHVRTRGTDWAQVFPEWGLAGNAAFIVGPRAMTRGLDLGRRCFLHSYEADVDPEGSALETILTAPLVVAQWISCQYYFSTVDPVVHGAGSKTIHNVVGGIGVLAGHDGDLKLGLPWQSVADGTRLVHEPMRLLAAVQAPLERIDEIVARNTILQHLFGNDWVALAAREHPTDPWLRHTPRGWQPWTREDQA
ncbi:DUF2309 domain-containing protein [Paraconexibacter sp.]|uniref:DUF2309 domain-containing protein n=1 Tax=Paraconexibacter sp. TaxID=2949640 RepID=UPI0035688ECD